MSCAARQPSATPALTTPAQVQSGVGRTGAWWGHTLFDGGVSKPDLLVFAKVGGGTQKKVEIRCLRAWGERGSALLSRAV